jgi:hypothetical protein
MLCGLGLALASACEDGVTGPPVDPNDLDGDGIPNAQDRCPGVGDPLQHDEDGDGFGDLCDVCPTVVDPLQGDTGEASTGIMFEDGVGDACDPRPSRGGDKIGELHTFADDTTHLWLGAGWAIADDRARAVEAARWQSTRAESGDALTARLAVESVAWTATGGSVAVSLDGDGVETARACAVFEDRDADGNDELEVRELGGAVEVRPLSGTITGPFELVVHRDVEHRTGAGAIHCRILGLAQPITLSIDTGDDTTTGQYVFAAIGADAVVTSLIVYKSPIACPTVRHAACPLP